MAYYRPDQRAQGQYLGQPSYPVQQQYFHVGQQYVFSGQQQSIAPGQQQYFAPGQQQPNDPGQQQYFASEQQQYYTPEQQQYFNSADNEQNASEQQAQDPPVQEAPLQTTFEPQHHSEIAFEEASLPPEAGSHNQLLLSYEPHDEDSMFSTSSSAVDTSVPSMFYGLPQAGQSLDVNAGNFGEGGSGPEVDMQDARAEAWAQSFQQNNSGHSAADTQFFYPEASGWVTPAPQSYLEQELLHTNPLPESHIPETNPEVSVTAFDRDVDNEHPSNASSPMHRDPDQTYNPGYPHQAETYPEQPLGYRNNIAPHDVEQAFAPRPPHPSGLSPLLSPTTTASASLSTVATDLKKTVYCNLLLPNGTRCVKRYSGKEKDAKRNLRRHKLSHVHNGATFPCEAPGCTKDPFKRKDFRKKHYESYHPELVTPGRRRSTAHLQRLDTSGRTMLR